MELLQSPPFILLARLHAQHHLHGVGVADGEALGQDELDGPLDVARVDGFVVEEDRSRGGDWCHGGGKQRVWCCGGVVGVVLIVPVQMSMVCSLQHVPTRLGYGKKKQQQQY